MERLHTEDWLSIDRNAATRSLKKRRIARALTQHPSQEGEARETLLLTQGSNEAYIDGLMGEGRPCPAWEGQRHLRFAFRLRDPRRGPCSFKHFWLRPKGVLLRSLETRKTRKPLLDNGSLFQPRSPFLWVAQSARQRLERFHCRLDRLTRHRSVGTLGSSSASL